MSGKFFIQFVLFLAIILPIAKPDVGGQPQQAVAAHPLEIVGIQMKATAIPDRGLGAVRVVMFWMDGCDHCHEVLDNVLPPIQEKYGEKLEIKLIELVGAEEVNALYQFAETRGISKEGVSVPFMVIGEHTLIGAQQIPNELVGLIEQHLAEGGVDFPKIPGIATDVGEGTSTPLAALPTRSPIQNPDLPAGIVHAVFFNTPGCHECDLIYRQVITPAGEKFGDSLDLHTINIITSEDVEFLYRTAAEYGFKQDQVDLPLLIIGDDVLVGEKILSSLPGLVEEYLSSGGAAYPKLPERTGAQTPVVKSSPTTPSSSVETAAPAGSADSARTTTNTPNGYFLAIVVMLVMAFVLVYTGICFFRLVLNHSLLLPHIILKFEWLIPILAMLGIAVSGYLAYVETQSVPAACGPVGDCSAVQSSPYASLFGFLPVGVLGLIGYVVILALWVIQGKSHGNPAVLAGAALFVIAFGGTLFSLYLTYLEPFVIRAVCMWCLTSAVIITLILLLSLGPVSGYFKNRRSV